MKRFVLILSMISGAFLTAGAQKSFTDLVGKWEIVGDDMPGASLEIIDSSQIYLTYDGERRKVSSVTFNPHKTPSWFDFNISDSSGTLQVKTLVHIYGNGIMKWQLFIEEERPEYFTSSKGEMMYLKKSSGSRTVASTQ